MSDEAKNPRPAFGHLLPSLGREKAHPVIAFAREPLRMGEGGQRPDEGLFLPYFFIPLIALNTSIMRGMNLSPKPIFSAMT